MNLPAMVYTSSKRQSRQVAFGGLHHTENASDGELYDMRNISSDAYPYLAPRAKRRHIYTGTVVSLCAVGDVLYFTQGGRIEDSYFGVGALYQSAGVEDINGVKRAAVEQTGVTFTEKGEILCVMGKRIILRLDGVPGVYNTETGEYRTMGALLSETATVGDGTLYEESAAANTITIPSGNVEGAGFSKGDAVHITIYGGTLMGETDAVIREISGTVISFDENTFDGMTGTWEVTIQRKVPDFDHICVCDNRLFACQGNTVWASALGDPFNWYVYDGISTDSYSTNTGDSGEFTACCEFQGYPHFFKADAIYKLYGSVASEYRLQKTNAFGVKKGASGSLSAVGSTLFYLSPAGVCAYSGGYPTVILSAEQMGGYPNSSAAAATVGHKYFLQVRMTEGYVGLLDDQIRVLFVYDTEKGIWHKEDADCLPACSCGYPGNGQINLFGYNHNGIYIMGTPAFTGSTEFTEDTVIGSEAGDVDSFVEFGYAFHDTTNPKRLYKVTVRLQVEKGARVKILASYDDGPYQTVYETRYCNRKTLTVPIRPKLCDRYRLKIEGVGDYTIYAITKEYSVSGK